MFKDDDEEVVIDNTQTELSEELSEGEEHLLQAIYHGCMEGSILAVPAIEKSTNQRRALLIVRGQINATDPQEYIFPIATLFNIEDKDIFNRYILPKGYLDESDDNQVPNVVFDEDVQEDDENLVEEKPSWWRKLLRLA